MKVTKRKVFIVLLMLVMFLSVSSIAMMKTDSERAAFAAELQDTDFSDSIYEELSESENVPAVFQYVRLNDTDCSVSLSNKSEATIAKIPAKAEINGVTYNVTEIAASGFKSAVKLSYVRLPDSLKKIGNMAFSGCSALQKIDMFKVEEIGNTVFYNCPKLETITIPKSVVKVGSYAFRNNNTLVQVRGSEEDCSAWTSSWNSNNGQKENTVYNFKGSDKGVVQKVYNEKSRSNSREILGYNVVSGQTGTEYNLIENNEENNIIIPAQYQGYDILAIDMFAYEGFEFDNLIIEYSDTPILVGSHAFIGTIGQSIIINRRVEYENLDDSEDPSIGIFSDSAVETIVLPDSVPGLAESMFSGCWNLKNIHFIEPVRDSTHVELLANIEELNEIQSGNVYLPQNDTFDVIFTCAFQGTTAIEKLHIYDNVKVVYANILDGWNEGNQAVQVHNTQRINFTEADDDIGWCEAWNGNFPVTYDKYFYQITFDANGGIVELTEIYVEENDVCYIPESTFDNHLLKGWYDEDGNEFISGSNYELKRDITLKAVWMDKVTYFWTNEDGKYRTFFATIGEQMPENIPVPTLTGYEFLGLYAGENGSSLQYYNEKMQSMREWTGEEIPKLYGNWKPIETIITYELNGGKNNENNINTILYSDKAFILFNPKKNGYSFYGWELDNELVEEIYQCTKKNIKLVAVWIEQRTSESIIDRVVAKSSDTEQELKSERELLILPSSGLSRYELTITSNVKEVHIYSRSYRHYSMNIIIEYRTSELKVYLENLCIEPPRSGMYAIYQNESTNENSGALNLYAYGNVQIYGAAGGFTSSETLDGTCAIYCRDLSINYADNLTILGGNGGLRTSLTSKVSGNPAEGIIVENSLTIPWDNVTIAGGCDYAQSYCRNGYKIKSGKAIIRT